MRGLFRYWGRVVTRAIFDAPRPFGGWTKLVLGALLFSTALLVLVLFLQEPEHAEGEISWGVSSLIAFGMVLAALFLGNLARAPYLIDKEREDENRELTAEVGKLQESLQPWLTIQLIEVHPYKQGEKYRFWYLKITNTGNKNAENCIVSVVSPEGLPDSKIPFPEFTIPRALSADEKETGNTFSVKAVGLRPGQEKSYFLVAYNESRHSNDDKVAMRLPFASKRELAVSRNLVLPVKAQADNMPPLKTRFCVYVTEQNRLAVKELSE